MTRMATAEDGRLVVWGALRGRHDARELEGIAKMRAHVRREVAFDVRYLTSWDDSAIEALRRVRFSLSEAGKQLVLYDPPQALVEALVTNGPSTGLAIRRR